MDSTVSWMLELNVRAGREEDFRALMGPHSPMRARPEISGFISAPGRLLSPTGDAPGAERAVSIWKFTCALLAHALPN